MTGGSLVTGGAGFVGSALVRRLLERTAGPVTSFDRLTYAGHRINLAALDDEPRHRLVVGDIGDAAAVADLLRETRPSVVYHLAAESHVDRSIGTPDDFVATNIVGTYTLLQVCLEHWRRAGGPFLLVHVSTDEVYGSLGPDGRFTETSSFDPSSPYAATKAAADHLVRAWHRTYGLPTITTHSANNYGPRQFPEKLIPLVVHNALGGAPLPVYGDGGNVRDWIFVDDHADALIAVAAKGRPGERYNIGAGCERSNLAIVETVCALLDELVPGSPHRPHRGLVRFVTDRPGHDRRYATDASKIATALGWRPAVAFDAGMRATVRWYLDNAAWRETMLGGGWSDPAATEAWRAAARANGNARGGDG